MAPTDKNTNDEMIALVKSLVKKRKKAKAFHTKIAKVVNTLSVNEMIALVKSLVKKRKKAKAFHTKIAKVVNTLSVNEVIALVKSLVKKRKKAEVFNTKLAKVVNTLSVKHKAAKADRNAIVKEINILIERVDDLEERILAQEKQDQFD